MSVRGLSCSGGGGGMLSLTRPSLLFLACLARLILIIGMEELVCCGGRGGDILPNFLVLIGVRAPGLGAMLRCGYVRMMS
jgi:hypothetical protein